MANPRKFSEKIALQMHRQAEETARFEQIMREVSAATAQSEETTQSRPMSHRVGRARSQAGPIRRPHDRRLDTSPYSSGSFLSPPPDTSWGNRRANSDSALHQSAMQGASPERNDSCSSNSISRNRWTVIGGDNNEKNDGRPRSSCDAVTRTSPRINIYPSPHVPGTVQIPIGNNTGSLPDLTNMDFASPISVPLDQERDQDNSPYGSDFFFRNQFGELGSFIAVNTFQSSANVSPSTSPTNIHHQGMTNQNHFQYNQTQTHPHANHLSVPVNNSYPVRPQKGIDENIPVIIDGGPSNIIYRQNCSPPSPSSTQPYRSPRPSPQSSPSLGGRHSAPCSPGAPSPLSNDYHNLFSPHQATQFQQNFEQLSMLDSPVNNASSYLDEQQQMTNPITSSNNPQSLVEIPAATTNIELTSDGGYFSTSPSQLMYPTTSPSLHTTPNTPTSIPDITLTDFSSSAEDAREDLVAVKQFENDLLSEDALRSSLEPLGLVEFQMLAENGINLIPDTIEEHFRLDHS